MYGSDLSGKTALVTGAFGGLGLHFARVLATHGARVALAGRRIDLGRTVAADIGAAVGRPGDIRAYALDVTDAASVADAVARMSADLGVPAIVVNNAGTISRAPSLELGEDAWTGVLDVNLSGVFRVAQASAREMVRTQTRGSIVNIASILGLVGDGILAAYCAAKGGVLGITRATAVQYGRDGIRCNAVCPGDIDTPLVQAYFDTAADPAALRAEISAEYPLERIAAPREVARAVVFLAGEDASFMSGQPLVVDGGLLATCY